MTSNDRNVPSKNLWGASEVAEYLGWRRNQVTAYLSGNRAGIPEPLARLKCGPIWDKDDVIIWAHERGYVGGEKDE